jgi:uncharacterized OB-fold protein
MAEKTLKGIGPEAQFKAYLAEGRFMVQRSRTTGNHVFYPRTAAPRCDESDLEWVQVSGDGVVYATTCTRRPAAQGGDYNIALIDLAEGVRMMSRVEGAPPDQVRIGMRVKAKIVMLRGEPAIVFTPV